MFRGPDVDGSMFRQGGEALWLRLVSPYSARSRCASTTWVGVRDSCCRAVTRCGVDHNDRTGAIAAVDHPERKRQCACSRSNGPLHANETGGWCAQYARIAAHRRRAAPKVKPPGSIQLALPIHWMKVTAAQDATVRVVKVAAPLKETHHYGHSRNLINHTHLISDLSWLGSKEHDK